MSAFGVVTGDAPVLGSSVTRNSAEDNVRRVVRALLAAREEVSAVELGAHLGMKKAAIYKRLNGTQPFTVGEVAAISSFFGVPVEILFEGPEALFGSAPEQRRTRSGGVTIPCLSTRTTVRKSDSGRSEGVVVSLADARDRRDAGLGAGLGEGHGEGRATS